MKKSEIEVGGEYAVSTSRDWVSEAGGLHASRAVVEEVDVTEQASRGNGYRRRDGMIRVRYPDQPDRTWGLTVRPADVKATWADAVQAAEVRSAAYRKERAAAGVAQRAKAARNERLRTLAADLGVTGLHVNAHTREVPVDKVLALIDAALNRQQVEA